jgi:transmembrane sensor
MGNDTNPSSDLVWEAAMSWVAREHERETFDASARDELARWLQADPAHRRAYDQACRLWHLAGFVPPATDIEVPGDEPD